MPILELANIVLDLKQSMRVVGGEIDHRAWCHTTCATLTINRGIICSTIRTQGEHSLQAKTIGHDISDIVVFQTQDLKLG
jgi:hypothetical protein